MPEEPEEPEEPEGRLSAQSVTRLHRDRVSQTPGAGRAMEAPAGPRWRQLDARRHHPAGDPADGAGAPASGHGCAVDVVERIRSKRSKDRSEERARVRRPA